MLGKFASTLLLGAVMGMSLSLTSGGALAQSKPPATCNITPKAFSTWFDGKYVKKNGAVTFADSVGFSKTPPATSTSGRIRCFCG